MPKIQKVKIVKKLQQNKTYKRKVSFTPKKTPSVNKFTEDYLKFYDDIKISSKRYDW